MDHYAMLQISADAEPETIHRVYRLPAQQLHPDNAETGNATRFRDLSEDYAVLRDPKRGTQYDVVHQHFVRDRRKVAQSAEAATFKHDT